MRLRTVRFLVVRGKVRQLNMISPWFRFDEKIEQAAQKARTRITDSFARVEEITRLNQHKVLAAFINNRVGEHCFAESTGYGYNDRGRETLEKVFAEVFCAEAALVRHSFTCGTHTLTVALNALLRPGDTMLCVTGTPYDTLLPVIGLKGSGMGSLKEYGVRYLQTDMDSGGNPDMAAISEALNDSVRLVYIQRSSGYAHRNSLSVEQIRDIVQLTRSKCSAPVMVDNCYGEFAQKNEPLEAGADIIAGSLIKNPGGGIAKTGGYIAGKRELVDRCAYRMTAPGIGAEVGATLGHNREMFLGFFNAPHVTGEAMKTAVFASAFLEELGYRTRPRFDEERFDIVQSVELGDPRLLQAFCKGIQHGSPVDSFAVPEAWDMPGYDSKVMMAAGAFTLGASIELSADAPLRPPYTVWLQGSLNFDSGSIGVMLGAQAMADSEGRHE